MTRWLVSVDAAQDLEELVDFLKKFYEELFFFSPKIVFI
jgi:hypothetical protein